MGNVKRRNASVERIRVLACMLVIWNHIQIILPVNNGVYYTGQALIYSIIRCNVPLFLIISGYFLFQNTYGREMIADIYFAKLKNFFVKIFIPSVIVVAFSAVFYTLIVDGGTIAEVFRKRDFHWSFLKNFLFHQEAEYICVHFWYVWTYAKIIVFFPLLAMLCKKDVDKTRIRRFLMLLSVMNLLLIEVMKFVGKSNVNLSDYTLDKYFLYVLIGYEIFLMLGKTDINIKKARAVAIALMLVGIFCEIILNYVYFYMNGTDYTSDCTTVISSVGLFVALNTLRETRISKIWNWLGRYTLYIYMVHSAVIYIYATAGGRCQYGSCVEQERVLLHY